MSANTEIQYVGGELDVFVWAQNWKRYWGGKVEPHLRGDVLEVGAGLGTNTRLLRSAAQRRWVCLEPDCGLLTRLRRNLEEALLPAPCELVEGTLAALSVNDQFDTILYIDVLEHIEDDAAELQRASRYLKPGGKLLVLSPAHQWLFSKFDAAIGHYRRYTKKTLLAVKPRGLRVVRTHYLDCIGFTVSLCNRLLLRQSLPTRRQILFWDRLIVPVSRLLDPLTGYTLGKSVLTVWAKPESSASAAE